jgi:hypothetical protein
LSLGISGIKPTAKLSPTSSGLRKANPKKVFTGTVKFYTERLIVIHFMYMYIGKLCTGKYGAVEFHLLAQLKP